MHNFTNYDGKQLLPTNWSYQSIYSNWSDQRYSQYYDIIKSNKTQQLQWTEIVGPQNFIN